MRRVHGFSSQVGSWRFSDHLRSTSAEADAEVEDQPGQLEPAASAAGVS